MYKVNCLDCDTEILVDNDYKEHEIVSCIACGVEYEVLIKDGKVSIKYIELEGEDWGE
jgi:transcription elongation factor Elf1